MIGNLIIQGMAGGSLLAQGWLAGPSSANPITQGLRGPWLLAQGFLPFPADTPHQAAVPWHLGGAGESRAILAAIGSGGAQLAGSSLAASHRVVPAAGGLVLAASAATAFTARPALAGGLFHGGSAGLAHHAAATSIGGLWLGGAPPGLSQLAPTTAGGLHAGGSATAARSFVAQPAGGLAWGGRFTPPSLLYHIYQNDGAGGPIDYAFAVASVAGLQWVSPSLSGPGRYKFAVRCYDPFSGLEEQNLDAAVELSLDESGRDVTRQPPPPVGLRAVPLPGGTVRIEWASRPGDPRHPPPDEFAVYVGSGGSIDFDRPRARIPWSNSRLGAFWADLHGLERGTHAVCVRARSFAAGEETNNHIIWITVDDTPPSAVDLLMAAATHQEP
jgi:hypothetical protein